MSKRQIAKIFPGTKYRGRKLNRWVNRLFEKYDRCARCGSKKNLEPHHIISCNPYDKLFDDVDNGALLCRPCHDRYHGTCFPQNRETFEEFCENRKPTNFQKKKFSLRKKKKRKRKSKQKYTLKEYEPHPEYSKIKINDFRKKEEKPKRAKKKKRRKRKLKRLNPMYIVRNLGTDNWPYLQRIELEKEVLGDYI